MTEAPPPSDSAAPKPVVPPPDAKPRRTGLRLPAAMWLGAMLVLALALIGTSPDWAPALMPLLPWSARVAQPPAPDQTAKRLAAIEQQLGEALALSGRVAALENKPPPDASAAVAPLADQVRQLGSRLDQIDTRLTQLAHDEAANADSPERVLIVALASLGNAVAGSRPFAAELASVEALGQDRAGWAAALRPLEASAKNGIPSTAILAQRFSSNVAPAILRAEAAAPSPSQGLGAAMLARLRGLIVIRRVDGNGAGASPTGQAVGSAQAALDKGDLAGAVTALNPLRGAPATAAQPWLQIAKQRLDAEQTIAKLSQELASDLAAGTGGG